MADDVAPQGRKNVIKSHSRRRGSGAAQNEGEEVDERGLERKGIYLTFGRGDLRLVRYNEAERTREEKRGDERETCSLSKGSVWTMWPKSSVLVFCCWWKKDGEETERFGCLSRFWKKVGRLVVGGMRLVRKTGKF